jgi:AraC family transcriptional regulator
LRKIRDYIAAHLGQPLTIGDLAELGGLSERQFYRAFRAATGETPLALVQKMRVEAAKPLLLAEGASICNIAAFVGFTSPAHFAKVFKARTGFPPNELRRVNRFN